MGFESICQILIENDAIVNQGNIQIKLLCYDSNGFQNDISVNIYNNEGMTPLHIACNSGNADMVELLLKLKANIDLRNNKGETCLLMRHNAKDYRIPEREDELHKACREGNEKKVVSILEKTLDSDYINKDDIHGWTPLHI
ncbi:ankyrin repeat domain-containing protein 27-like [Mytilus californianus]|uniref:ankyrin repeat domain-containing protein 27-like n=1 Tax=Mytilus californianus TaxID=6549 RepID=UPI002248462D|nr:ankyrin repeat domain-containing protein 27-like [Mytilus californianus]